MNYKGRLIDLSEKGVMAIVNVTSDSFFDGGCYLTEENLVNRVAFELSKGALIIDLGACSSRPGAVRVSEDDELKQIVWAVEVLKREFSDIVLSIDTYRSAVAIAASNIWGEVIVNDISAGDEDSRMVDFVAANKFPYVAMHYSAENINNEDVTSRVVRFFYEKMDLYQQKGVDDVIIDVGFGFGKSLEENFELVKNFERFKIFNTPLLVGVSRKSMIYRTLESQPSDALNGTTVINTILAAKGANIFRVHDTLEACEMLKLIKKGNLA